MNKYVSLCISLLLLLSVAAYAEPEREGSLLPNKDAAKLRYVPDRVIVKLRQERLLAGKTPKSALDIKYKDRKDYDERTLSGLKARHRIKSHAPVFNGLHRAMAANELSVRECNLQQNLRFRQRMRRIKAQAAAPDLFPVYVLNTEKTEDIDALCNELNTDPDVEYAQPDYIQTIALTPNDPYYNYTIPPEWYGGLMPWGATMLWNIEKINARTAWDGTNSHSLGEGIVVAVIDTGVDYTHEDLRENMWVNPREVPGDGIDNDANGCPDDIYGFDFGSSVDANGDGDYVDAGDTADSNPYDEDMHGTLMAGTIAAAVNNNIGIYGVAPRAKIMAIKASTPYGQMSTSAIIKAINYAMRNGADVVNNSYCSSTPVPSNPVLENAVLDAYISGLVMVFAAGNNNSDVINYSPRQLDAVITAAGTDVDDQRYWASNYGAMVDVAAPAYGIFSCNTSALVGLKFPQQSFNSKYLASAGTSFAAAHVSGLAALVLARNSNLPPDLVEQAIRQNTAPITPAPDQPIGTGRIDALQTLGYVASTSHIAITRTVFANDQLKVYAIMCMPTPSAVTLSWKYSNSSTGETVGTVTPPAVNEEFLAGTITHRGFNNRIINLKIQAGSFTNETSFYYSRLYGLEFVDRTSQKVNLLGNDEYYLRATLLGTTWTNITVDYKKTGDTVWQTAGVNALWSFPINHDINCDLICAVDAGYITQPGDYIFRVTTQASGGGNPYTNIATIPVEVDSSTMRGWPVYAEANTFDHEALVVDFDGDSDLEICINTPNAMSGWPGLQILHSDGREDAMLSRYGYNFLSINVGLSACDIDNAYGEEILIPMAYELHLLNGDNSVLSDISPWPYDTGYLYNLWIEQSPPVFADINNDRISEIIGIHTRDYTDYYLEALDIGKNTLFSIQLPHHGSRRGDLIDAILTCDIDNDGKKEIIVATQAGSSQVPYLRAYNDNGTECIGSGWPVNMRALSSKNTDYLDNYYPCSLRLADMNADGNMEIIFTNYLQELFVLKKNGTVYAGWPRDIKEYWWGGGDIAVGNLDGDRNPEIAVTQGGYLSVFNENGTPLAGWPVSLGNIYHGYSSYYFKTPVIADIDNDGTQEVLVCGFVYDYSDSTAPKLNRFILAFSANGVLRHRWELHGSSTFEPGIVIADIDKDGILELIGIGDLPSPPSPDLVSIPTLSRIFVWKLDGSDSTSHLDWPMYKADTQRTASWFPWGDVNTDGKTDVIDAQACINQFLGIQNWGKRADVKNDGGVNILDIQQLVNIILGV